MKELNQSMPAKEMHRHWLPLRNAFCLVALLALPELALAGGDAADFADDACVFVNNIKRLLQIASVAVVTIAIIFAGYQIAFAHKRIADVAPILIGGLLIGAAGQIAGWILQRQDEDCTPDGMTLLVQEGLRYLV